MIRKAEGKKLGITWKVSDGLPEVWVDIFVIRSRELLNVVRYFYNEHIPSQKSAFVPP